MQRYMILLLCIIALHCCTGCFTPVAPHITERSAGTIKAVRNGRLYPYYLHIPADYDRHAYAYPLLIFLHGAGELHEGLSPLAVRNGPLEVLYRNDTEPPDSTQTAALNIRVKSSFVYVPQTNDQQRWNEPIEETIQMLIDTYPIDENRIYLTGLSMGGKGVWEYAEQNPERYAAIVPVCGTGTALGKEVLADMPVWAFYSFDDAAVPIRISINPILERILGIDSLMDSYPHKDNNPHLPAPETCTISFKKGGTGVWTNGVPQKPGRVNYTLYPDIGHEVWTPAYQNQAMWKWLYSQRRNRKKYLL